MRSMCAHYGPCQPAIKNLQPSLRWRVLGVQHVRLNPAETTPPRPGCKNLWGGRRRSPARGRDITEIQSRMSTKAATVKGRQRQ